MVRTSLRGHRLSLVFPALASFSLAPSALAERVDEPASMPWQEIKPGGQTRCARGEEFSFFVSRGRTDKVVIDFIGGGACWNAETCSKEGATFTDSVDELRKRYAAGLSGVYDRERSDNPLRDWTHVVVPYCTGDIHWGSQEVAYERADGSRFTIHHKGAVNTQAVLDWMAAELPPRPERVLVTGCSAGAYGSIYWTPHLKRMYPHSELRQFGDSGAGVVTQEFFINSFPLWHATAAAASWIPQLDPVRNDWRQLSLVDLYRIVGNYHPDVMLAQYNTAYDGTQTFFYEVMGGAPEEWTAKMYRNVHDAEASLPNFRSYIGPGEEHCVLPYERFYSQKSNDTAFKDWFGAYIEGRDPGQVACHDCKPPF